MKAEFFDEAQQTEAARRLLHAVVASALRDLAIQGWQPGRRTPGERVSPKTLGMSTEAFTAARFLFDEDVPGVDAYLEWLDVDPPQFRKRLLDIMHNNSPLTVAGWAPEQRRAMRINFKKWREMRTVDIPEGDDHD